MFVSAATGRTLRGRRLLSNSERRAKLRSVVRIEGRRLVLREWRADELDAMHRWLGNPEVARFLSWGSRTREESARHLAECVRDQGSRDRQRYFLAVELQEGPRVIGDAGFHWTRQDGDAREGEFGYFLEPDSWGRGFATEAARLVLELAFARLRATVMRASCNARNSASERVMQKCGMQREPGSETAGRRAYRILRAEWEAGSGGL
jgi:RimJ/RimL family protein N-acetyltransferase